MWCRRLKQSIKQCRANELANHRKYFADQRSYLRSANGLRYNINSNANFVRVHLNNISFQLHNEVTPVVQLNRPQTVQTKMNFFLFETQIYEVVVGI